MIQPQARVQYLASATVRPVYASFLATAATFNTDFQLLVVLLCRIPTFADL